MLADVTTLQEPLTRVLGPKTGKALESLSLHTVGDLIRHYPRRFYSRGELTDLSSLREGDHVTVLARVVSVAEMPLPSLPGKGRRSRLEVIVTDDRAKLVLTFFSGIHQYRHTLRPDVVGMFAGTVSSYRNRRQLVHPECEMLPGAAPNADLRPELAAEFATEMIPVYPASAKVPSWRIAKSVKTVLDTLDVGDDPLPAELRERYELAGRAEAVRAAHRPLDPADRKRALHRLKWDEAFLLQSALAQRRLAAAAMPAMPRPRLEGIGAAGGIAAEFDARLPFTLTAGQVAVGETIAAELACAYPMHRLLQGEVGSGKTVIAVRAMLQVVDAGGQAALLAPTEVLAQQHYRSITDMLGPLARRGQLDGAEHGTGVALLTGSLGAAARRSALSDVFTGDAGIVIGTHALLEDQVQFADLGLVVIDEQHRFGVEQRDALRAKAADNRPHVLVMTATPIPRTVAMTVYGDLETSTLTELPAGRSPIASFVVPAADKPRFLERAWERVREEVNRGQQAYVVCPRIGDDQDSAEDTEDTGVADIDVDPGPGQRVDMEGAFPRGVVDGRRQPLSVLDVAAALDAGPLAGLRLGILHGRLHPEEKDQVMREFSAGQIDVLVATTVIEVGVDVPNATVMVVMDAERFGVSQLHQLRGRVGRGSAAGLCLLVSEAPPASPARERLEAVAATLDGFKLSRLDLEQRREGDVLGAAQAGRQSSLRLLRLLADEDLIGRAREEASAVVGADPHLAEHPALREAIEELLGVQAEYLDKT
jgi:ATP-dependent DNA helicase RecG